MKNLNPSDYYSQRNNPTVVNQITGITVQPWAACMPTARAMFYKANKIQINTPLNEMDDAWLTSLMITPEAVDFAKTKYPDLKGYPPNEIHGMYGSYLDQIVCGRRISNFVDNLTFMDIQDRMISGQAVMTSGAFEGIKGPIDGHAFCFAGIDDNGNLLLADPYGDFRTKYQDARGYMVPMSIGEFNQYVKPIGSGKKWGHILI